MEIRLNILHAILLLLVFNIHSLSAQIKAVNDKGEKIIVFPDGTWEYDKEGEEEKTGTASPDAEEPPKVVEEIAYTREEMIAARDEVTQLYRTARRDREMAQKEEGKYSYELASYEQKIERERAMGTFPKIEADEVAYKSKVRGMRAKVSDAKKKQKAATKREKKLQKMLTYSGDKLMVAYNKMKQDETSPGDEIANMTDGAPEKPKKSWNPIKILKPNKKPVDPQEAARQDYERELNEIRKKSDEEFEKKVLAATARSERLEKYLDAETIPSGSDNCELAFDEMDPFTAKRKRATTSRMLFSVVDEDYEPILKGKGYIDCHGFISELNNGKNLLLVLEYKVKSTTAKEEFGGFVKGAKLAILLIDGTMVHLNNSKEDKGEVIAGQSITTFKGYYEIPKSAAKDLMSKEASLIRVLWANGFEDYDIYEMDFFSDQLNCLKSKN